MPVISGFLWRISERNALHDEALRRGGLRRGNQVARAFDADVGILRIGRNHERRVWLVDRMDTMSWQAMAWWIHDNLPYSELQFFPKLFAFNIGWHEAPKRTIYSFIEPRGFLTKPGFSNHDRDHSHRYQGFPQLKRMS